MGLSAGIPATPASAGRTTAVPRWPAAARSAVAAVAEALPLGPTSALLWSRRPWDRRLSRRWFGVHDVLVARVGHAWELVRSKAAARQYSGWFGVARTARCSTKAAGSP